LKDFELRKFIPVHMSLVLIPENQMKEREEVRRNKKKKKKCNNVVWGRSR